jgi:hypothetical protein
MAVTLAQAKLNVTDDLQLGIIDEFAKSSFIMNNIPFHQCVSPVGGGATLTYGYTRLVTQPVAEFRSVNSEYNTHEVEKQRYTTDLKVFGGAFEVDRLIANMGGIADEVALQSSQKVKAASALFSDTIINGNSSTDANVFDGLDVAVTGTDTEYIPAANIDLSTSEAVTANATAFVDQLDEWLGTMEGVSVILCNAKMAAKLRAVARRMGVYQLTKNDFGQGVEYYGDIPFVDLGAKPGSNDPIVGIDEAGLTSIYAVKFGMDAFHAIGMENDAPVKIWLPDFTTAGAVKKGEVEMVAGCALKSTKAAGVFRGIKVK